MAPSKATNISCIALSALAAVLSVVAIFGVDSGWAYGEKSMSDKSPWAPEISMVIHEGWWSYTAKVQQSYVPQDLPDLQGDDAKMVGVLAIVGTTAALLCALLNTYVNASELRTASTVTYMAPQLQGFANYTCMALQGTMSVFLYALLSICTHNKLADQFGPDMALYPRPSWASLSAWLSALCLLPVAILSQNKSIFPEGYAPLV